MTDKKVTGNQEDSSKKDVNNKLKTIGKQVKKPLMTTSKEESADSEDNTEVKFRAEGRLLLVRVGNDVKPATAEDIEEVENKIIKLLDDNGINCAALVTHHAVTIDLI